MSDRPKLTLRVDAMGLGTIQIGDVDISRICTGVDYHTDVNGVTTATIRLIGVDIDAETEVLREAIDHA